VAATLSFVVPGAGQAWAGRIGRGMVVAAPLIILLVAAGVVLATQGTARTLGMVLQPGVLLGFTAANLLLAGWRAFATVDAYRIARRRWPAPGGRAHRPVAVAVLVAFLVTTLGAHAGLAYVEYTTYETVTTVFSTPSPTPTAVPTPAPSTPVLSPRPTPNYSPTPAPAVPETWASDGRLDILLMGIDEGPGRYSLRPDALILLSVDVASGQAALFAIPRYLQNVPLPPRSVNAFPCRCFPGYINALFRHAEDNPVWFSGPDRERGLLATQEAIGALAGLHLDGRIVVNFRGFIQIVDALGGVTMNVPYALYDPTYPNPNGNGTIAISWAPGVQWMDGFRALAFARTRHQDSDYHRLFRQELVVLALRRQMNPCNLIPRLPGLLQAVGGAVSINVPVEELPNLLNLAARVTPEAIARYYIFPPDIPLALDATAIQTIRAMVREPFDAPAVQVPGGSPDPVPNTTPLPVPGPVC
jgi:LCP family protein required for cell wall assembly